MSKNNPTFTIEILHRETAGYTYEQFYEITLRLLSSSRFNVNEEIAEESARAVWSSSRNLRDCIRIGAIAKSREDVGWLVHTFFGMQALTLCPAWRINLAFPE